MTPDDEAGPSVPETIGRFEVRSLAGTGTNAIIYSAWDAEAERRVAIKVLRDNRRFRPDSRARFLREAKSMSRVRHPNIVEIYEVGMHDGRVFLALEYVEGRTFREWLDHEDPGIPAILDHYMAAGRGLEAAHAAGVMHRDFKPENVLLGHDGRVRVADFGLARSTRGTDSYQTLENQTPGLRDALAAGPELLATMGISGTPAYKALEQHFGRPTDPRADQFAFCVALWEAVYGLRPFAGRSAGEIARAIEAGRIREPDSERANLVPRRIRKILERGLAAERVDRYPSMGELLDELDSARQGGWFERLLGRVKADKR